MRVIFLDRDGTINVDKNFVYKREELEIIPGTIQALNNLKKLGFNFIIITNQSGIGRGYYTQKEYKEIMQFLYETLNKDNIKILDDFFCPHKPEEKCKCRKPETELIEKAIKKYRIDRKESFFIGDKTADILAGKKANLKTILVLTGKAGKDGKYHAKPDYICNDLLEASLMIKSILKD